MPMEEGLLIMGYRDLQHCVLDLERHGMLRRIDTEIDPHLELAEIQRRVYLKQGPALLFTRVKGTPFPMLGNLFGTLERTRFLFRDTLEAVRKVVALKVDPGDAMKRPWRYLGIPFSLWNALPRRQWTGPILRHKTTLRQLPQLKCWPRDGGAFVTLPLVYSEDPNKPGWMKSNLGMYRVQISGNDYIPDAEVGLHYQIHRGIGVHHHAALEKGQPFHVNVIVGGPPSLTVSAVMPLPEGMPEVAFAGGPQLRHKYGNGHLLAIERRRGGIRLARRHNQGNAHGIIGAVDLAGRNLGSEGEIGRGQQQQRHEKHESQLQLREGTGAKRC
jgi:4-hydroxy-3-polyprenylbenzoate decarboxylase